MVTLRDKGGNLEMKILLSLLKFLFVAPSTLDRYGICVREEDDGNMKLLILAFDGLEARLVERWQLPNLLHKRL